MATDPRQLINTHVDDEDLSVGQQAIEYLETDITEVESLLDVIKVDIESLEYYEEKENFNDKIRKYY